MNFLCLMLFYICHGDLQQNYVKSPITFKFCTNDLHRIDMDFNWVNEKALTKNYEDTYIFIITLTVS